MKNARLTFAAVFAIVILVITGSNGFAPSTASAQSTLYTSCEADKLTAPLTSGAAATPAATSAATTAASAAATQAATTASSAGGAGDDIVFLSIVGSESEACYATSETFLSGNFMGLTAGFNGAVGITKTISGDIALDRTNVANSQIGDITINISEFKSDNDRRDGFIRQNFLESNKYPYATLTGATVIGLPNGPYQDGQKLQFKVKGTLTVHDTKRDTTFDATGSFSNCPAWVVRYCAGLNSSSIQAEGMNA